MIFQNSNNYTTTKNYLLIGFMGNRISTISNVAGTLLTYSSGGIFTNSTSGNFTFEVPNNGIPITVGVTNSSNNSSAAAADRYLVGGVSAGDPFLTYTITGATNFSVGADNSDADRFKISASTALGTTDAYIIQSTGEILQPLTPCFMASQSATVSNVTGDGTDYTANYNTKIFDQNVDYNNTTFTFTAPVTGIYCFHSNCNGGNLGASTFTIGTLSVVTSNRTYVCHNCTASSLRDGSNYYNFLSSVLADMDSGDTATIRLTISGGTKTAGQGVFSGTFRFNFHSGALEA